MIPLLRGEAAEAWIANGPSDVEDGKLEASVAGILRRVREEGDQALLELARQFGDLDPALVSQAEQVAAAAELDQETRDVLARSADNISTFAGAIAQSVHPVRVQSAEVESGMDLRPVHSAACYAPGGRHPLPSTVLMTGLAARAAGVPHIDLVCPSPHPAIMAAAQLVGFRRVYRMGGAQAIAALAYGTEMVERVDMVVGPGNAFVTEAKRQLQGVIGIDMLAGPSEVVIVADAGANPRWVALDLLAQAEHDPDARSVLLTWDETLAERVREEIGRLLESSDYPSFLRESLRSSAVLLLADEDACLAACDRLAPEHLHLAMAEAEQRKERVRHYGGLFLGYAATVPFGDYTAGPNHTLPTNRTARFSGGLSPLTFLRPQCWVRVRHPAPQIASDTDRFSRLEGLLGHAAAARARLD